MKTRQYGRTKSIEYASLPSSSESPTSIQEPGIPSNLADFQTYPRYIWPMTSAWINLSTRLSLASVQAALSVIISTVGTTGIWSFSRFWWQRAGIKVVGENTVVPLAALYTITAPGDGWDVAAVLGRRILDAESWHLLFQLAVVITVTLGSLLSGPIATLSSRTTHTVQKSTLDVLRTIKPAGSSANLLGAIVLWNETIVSLNQALFPFDQLLDFLPPSTTNWTYLTTEWNPTWAMKCNFTNETILHNVIATGNSTFYDPIKAFPAYRDTYDASWLDTSKYRVQADFDSWTAGAGVNAPFTDVLFFIMIESNPAIDDRWSSNNETMELSMSVLHAQNVSALNNEYFNQADATTWRPTGLVGNASYARFECSITRKPNVRDENLIPWVWTNDTYSITMQYRANWDYPFLLKEMVNYTYPTPTPKELLRFYQAYMVTLGTSFDVTPSRQRISVWMDTVQLSIVFLSIIIVLTALILCVSIRYFIFIHRHKSKLKETLVPDGKLEWMLHAARRAAEESEAMDEGAKTKDKVYFGTATFGQSGMDMVGSDAVIRHPPLARVYARGSSVSGNSPRIRKSISTGISNRSLPPLVLSDEKNPENDRTNGLSTVDPTNTVEAKIFSSGSLRSSRDPSPHSGGKMLSPQVWRKISIGGNRSSRSFEASSSSISSHRPIVPDEKEISPTGWRELS